MRDDESMAAGTPSGKHIVVTGASSGIGAALARELGRRGARVGLVARRKEALDALAAAIDEAGPGRASVAVADVTDAEGLAAAVGALESELGPVWGVIANAGVGRPTPRGQVRADRDGRVIEVNVNGVINTIAAVQPGLLARREGFIAAVSSLAGWRGLPGSAAYSASKAAVSTFLEALRLDLRGSNISVTTVHPGFVQTPMTDRNPFKMPFIIEVDRAARIIADGVLRGKRQVNFPWQLVLVMRAARLLPAWLYERMAPVRKEP